MTGEQVREGGATELTPLEVEEVVRRGYGFTVEAQQRLGGEVDQNVWVQTDDGRQFLFKASFGEVDEALRWQQTVLSHLERSAPEIPVPRLVTSRSGAAMLSQDISGRSFVVRLLSWLPGSMLAELEGVPPHLLAELGTVAARLTLSLAELSETSVASHHWDIRKSRLAVDEALPFVTDATDRRCVSVLMAAFDRVLPRLESLPMGVVHQDLNDFNVLALPGADGRLRISGVLDVNDSLYTVRVAELAIAVAYALLRQDEPLEAAAMVVAAFHAAAPLSREEVSVIFPLAAARLCVNATTWTRRTAESHHPYGRERMRHTWPTLRRITAISPAAAEQRLLSACGIAEPTTLTTSWKTHLPNEPIASAFPDARWTHVDWGPAGSFFDERSWTDPADVAAGLDDLLGDRTARKGFTRHLQPSMVHSARRLPGPEEPATIQLGTCLLVREGESVHAPLSGTVVRVPNLGPMVLHHPSGAFPGRDEFWTCWWGVDSSITEGAQVGAGERLGAVARPDDVRGLGATLHVQILLDPVLLAANPPIWVRPSEALTWAAATADPGPLLGLPAADRAGADLDSAAVVALRDRRLARSQRAYYREPPKLVRGRGVWLYDEHGRGYLDAINNVSHVGHAEPRVSAAAVGQLRKLNTNSRFIYDGIATYAERLVATLPTPLEVVFLVCTGSEANDLALRIARQVTGRTDVMVIDGAYHGNTAAVMGISPNRYKGPGGRGAPPTTHEVVCPDVYRGPFGRHDPQAGHKYAQDVQDVAQRLVDQNRPPAAFIAESLMGTAGNIVFPDGYLKESFDAVRKAGGLCISDEVQVGVGRLGSHFWGFQVQDVVPDIVTMGKPLGNGHPIAAVVTTREIADAFDDGVKYFNTFGGNPVSCAIGTAVLDIVEDDHLQAHAFEVGRYFLTSLENLKSKHTLIGDVRGQGLYLGIELVRDRDNQEPATSEALEVCEAMKDHGVIVYPTGAYDNVIKLKPPMVFSRADADFFSGTLDQVLSQRAERGH